jgi:Glycosyltransferase family 87
MTTPQAASRTDTPRPRQIRTALTALSAALVLMLLTALVADPEGLVPDLDGSARLVLLVGGAWLAYAVGAWLIHKLPTRSAIVLIILGGVALPLVASFGPPRSSDDLYRYLWDGRVQAAGVDPYGYVPAAPELVNLRDDFLWPPDSNWCVTTGTTDPDSGRPLVPGCTLINRPTVHTIYPPVAQILFLAIHALSPPGSRHQPIQVAMAVFAIATTVLLVVGLRSAGADPRRAVLWAWCPLVAVEAGSNGHVDVAAVFATGLSLLVLARARSHRASAVGGVLFGLAIATKLTPALVAPALLRRRPLTTAASATAAVAAVYLPHLLAVGPAVIGYLPGYLTEEGYADGSRFALLALLMPHTWAAPLAIAILLVVAVMVARRTDPDRPWLAATTMTGVALLVATPSYSWYAMLLVLLVALGGRPEWLAVAVAGQLAQHATNLDLDPTLAQRIGYGVALAVVIVGTLYRARARPS